MHHVTVLLLCAAVALPLGLARVASDCAEPSDFHCASGANVYGYGGCIRPWERCDGRTDCTDNSDEADCGPPPPSACSGFYCVAGRPDEHPDPCLPSAWQCDHEYDCVDGADEVGCDGAESTTPTTTATTTRKTTTRKPTTTKPTTTRKTTIKPTTATKAPPTSKTTTTKPSTTTWGGVGTLECGKSAPQYPNMLGVIGDRILGIGPSIMGGREAVPHSYPWIVYLKSRCGGTLISDQWVLTAAHCVDTPFETLEHSSSARHSVTVGMHSHEAGGTDVSVSKVVAHPDYRGVCNGIGHDIAVMKLSEPVTFGSKVKPICLPDSTDDFRHDGEKVVTAGWGAMDYGGYPDRLQHVVVSVAMRQCEENYSDGRSELRHNASLEVCAADLNKDSCSGDSGGPLFALKGGRFTQVGVVSCGEGCGKPGYPGVYAHVPDERDWIRQVTGV